MKKRSLILFELLIALSLLALMLMVLFRFFANSVQIDQKIERTRRILSAREYLHTRLSNIFSSLVPRSLLPPTNPQNFSFYTEGSILSTAFDNGIDPNPDFSGPIISKLFIDKDRNLILTLSPLEKQALQRKEILLSGVESLNFQFLAKKDFQKPSPYAISINKVAEWRSQWEREQWELPSLVRMTIRQEKKDLSFAFLLPFPEPAIVYRER